MRLLARKPVVRNIIKQPPRPVLIFLFCAGVVIALWPVGQMGYGWWGQRKLESNWSDAVAAYRAEHPRAGRRSVPAKPLKVAQAPRPVSAQHMASKRSVAKLKPATTTHHAP